MEVTSLIRSRKSLTLRSLPWLTPPGSLRLVVFAAGNLVFLSCLWMVLSANVIIMELMPISSFQTMRHLAISPEHFTPRGFYYRAQVQAWSVHGLTAKLRWRSRSGLATLSYSNVLVNFWKGDGYSRCPTNQNTSKATSLSHLSWAQV